MESVRNNDGPFISLNTLNFNHSPHVLDTTTLTIEHVADLQTGTNRVRHGATWGTIQMLPHFSHDVLGKYIHGSNASALTSGQVR